MVLRDVRLGVTCAASRDEVAGLGAVQARGSFFAAIAIPFGAERFRAPAA
ncbi:hypothetical protein HMPREF0591_4866 [Mycobacterium parascrofulaceum ATCC BAA-614]|uniref:Uncharacterized protein n=1 Tax=Mycobacterium parascrofulaceum ATCC BAA-614 TaxID=525368 RepID=D5PFB8_9MYCO|nr:hypothetical protein HMPREF0591_4866 [Mycobacterium parascrofulaceum ATCC BAA-614]